MTSKELFQKAENITNQKNDFLDEGKVLAFTVHKTTTRSKWTIELSETDVSDILQSLKSKMENEVTVIADMADQLKQQEDAQAVIDEQKRIEDEAKQQQEQELAEQQAKEAEYQRLVDESYTRLKAEQEARTRLEQETTNSTR